MPSMTAPCSGPSVIVTSTVFGDLDGSIFCVPTWNTLSPNFRVCLSPSKMMMNPFSWSAGSSMPPITLDSMFQEPWNFLVSFSTSALSSANALDQPRAAKPTTQHKAARETQNRVMLHLTRLSEECSAQAPQGRLFHLRNLDEIAAGVVKHSRDDWPHLHGRLREANTRRNEALIFRIHVLDVKRVERNPILHERLLEWLDRRVLVRFQHKFHAPRVFRRDD